MRKGTIFKYELKRLLLAKEYLLLLTATLVYAVSLLRGVVLYGTDYTAPFSRLTFGTYCGALATFLFVLLLVLCARQSKVSERGAEAIISATPMPVPVFRLLRCGAIACAFLFAVALPLTACLTFYQLMFDYTASGALIGLGLLLILPSSLLLFGIAVMMGNRSAAAIYVLLGIILIVSVFQIPLPPVFDLFGSACTGDFTLTAAFIAGRAAFAAIGLALTVAVLFQNKARARS